MNSISCCCSCTPGTVAATTATSPTTAPSTSAGPTNRWGAHVGPKFNPHSIGICYEGGLNENGQFADTRTEAQKRSMAALIRELKTRFPKARILSHRDLPGVRKACPCYDVAKDQNGEKPSQSLKTLPRIRDAPMHWVQKHEPDPRDIYSRGAEA